MSLAVITQPSQPWKIATLTRVQFSGMDSWFLSSSTPDCALYARSMIWDFGDGSNLLYGMHVAHTYALFGTYTVKLTVTWSDGSTSTAQVNVTIVDVPTFATFKKYVDPTRPDDNGDGNTLATAYKTLERAFNAWRNLGTQTQFGQILVTKGQNVPFVGLNDFVTHNKSPNQGPLFITGTGLGTRPNLQISATVQIDVDSSGAQDRPVYVDGIDLTWAAASGGYWSWNNDCGQLSNSICTNGQAATVRGAATAFYNVQIVGASTTCFINNSFFDAESCVFRGNGTHGDDGSFNAFDHQCYDDGAYQGFRGCTFDDAARAGQRKSFAGLKTSGASRVWVSQPIVNGTDCGFDIGSNPDNPNTRDYVIDAPVLNTIGRFGFYPQSCDRVVVKNAQVFGGCADSVVRLQPFSSAKPITDFQFLCGSIDHPTGQFVYWSSGNGLVTRGIFKNNAVKAAVGTSQPLIKSEPGVTFVGTTFDSNDYFREGGAHGDTNFATVNGAALSFDGWVATGQDPLGQYADPLFVSDSDLHLQAASPCVDKGATLGSVGLDAFGNVRPQGSAYDIGAAESQHGGGFMTFRQYFSEIRVGFPILGFESFAAIDQCIRAAIAVNPICNLNGQNWVYPGTDSGNPAHVFVFLHKRWERGLTLWYVICGQDDGTEAHETGIPGYALGLGYDATLQGLMDKYPTDVGDSTVGSKLSHYEVVWRKKQDKSFAPGGAPPAPLNPVFTETATVPPTTRVTGGPNTVPLLATFSETRPVPVVPGGPPQGYPLLPTFSESLLGVVVPNTGPQITVPLLKTFSRWGINIPQVAYSPAQLHFALFPDWSETNVVQISYTVQGGAQQVSLLPTFSETNETDPSTQFTGGGSGAGIFKIWSESATVAPLIHVIGGTRHINLLTTFAETAAQALNVQVQGGAQGVLLPLVFSETDTLNPSKSQSGNQNVGLLTTFSEDDLLPLDFQVIFPNLVNLIAVASDGATRPIAPNVISTPQAVSAGDFSGGVQLSQEF